MRSLSPSLSIQSAFCRLPAHDQLGIQAFHQIGLVLLFVGNRTRFWLYDLLMLVSWFWTVRSPSPALSTHEAGILPIPSLGSIRES